MKCGVLLPAIGKVLSINLEVFFNPPIHFTASNNYQKQQSSVWTALIKLGEQNEKFTWISMKRPCMDTDLNTWPKWNV